ncbi:PHP domain protein [Mycobacterium xenopi 3993]|nr:PHP domain protein [Mycobacterium xenopi 3993]
MHLHNHTEYSMLDGAAKISPMLAEAQRLGMSAIGMTDHGNMFGASEFYNACTEAGIKPIIGSRPMSRPAHGSTRGGCSGAIRRRRATTSQAAGPTPT